MDSLAVGDHLMIAHSFADEIFRRLKARIDKGALGPGTAGAFASLRVTLRQTPVATAPFEGALGS